MSRSRYLSAWREGRCKASSAARTRSTVERAIHEGDFDEIIVSTLPKKRSKWLRRDLIRQIKRLGCP